MSADPDLNNSVFYGLGKVILHLDEINQITDISSESAALFCCAD